MEKELSKISMQDEFALYAKTERKIAKLSTKLSSCSSARAVQLSKASWACTITFHAILGLTLLVTLWSFGGTPVLVQVPVRLATHQALLQQGGACQAQHPNGPPGHGHDLLEGGEIDCYEEIEVLRGYDRKKRKQSPSPNRSNKRHKTPHTPRKDTPKKTCLIFCRNEGCIITFGTVRARNLHERSYCSLIEANFPDLGESYEVPSHDSLGLNPLQCRYPSCDKIFKQSFTRQRHERDVHRFTEQRGRTCSPNPIPSLFGRPPEVESLNNSSFRPQSCPPNISAQFDTPISDLSLQPPVFHSTPCTSPSTKQRDLYVSSSARSLFAATESDTKLCQFCYYEFKDARWLKRHCCIFKPDKSVLQESCINPVVLTRPLKWKETFNIINQLCIEDQVKLCQINLWAIPSVYPLTFPGNYRTGHHGNPPVLVEMSAWINRRHSLEILRKLVDLHGTVELPRYLLLVNSSTGVTSYFPPSMLTPPPDEFTVEIADHHIIVSKKTAEKETAVGGSGSVYSSPEASFRVSDPDGESHWGDPEDVFEYCQDEASDRNQNTTGGADHGTVGVDGGFEHGEDLCDVHVESLGGTHGDGDPRDEESLGGGGGGVGGGGGGEDPSDTSSSVDEDLNSDVHNESLDGSQARGGGGTEGGGEDPSDDDISSDVHDESPGGGGEGGGGGGGDGEDRSDDSGDTSSSEDEDVNNNNNNNLPQEILNLLPDNFDYGIDGMGSANNPQKKAANLFRNPLRFNSADFEHLIKMTKNQFLQLVPSCVGSRIRKSDLHIFAQVFLFFFKLTNNVSFRAISTVFSLASPDTARSIFWDLLLHQYCHNCNIPAIVTNGSANQAEIDKLLSGINRRTPGYYKELLKNFEDPKHLGRTPVLINADATYFDVQNSNDIELQKYLFYKCRSGHTVKWINFTDLLPKFVGIVPIASSQSPSSGDSFLLSTHIALEDDQEGEKYVRTLLRGNNEHFVILATDAGFVTLPPNAPQEFTQNPSVRTLAQICEEEGAILLHTSSKSEKYHLQETENGKIIKVAWQEGFPTLDENVVKLTRMIRKTQEQIHGALKQMFPMLNVRKLYLDSLKPLPQSQLLRFNLVGEEFKNMPRLNFIATVCCSLLNTLHPGFKPAYLGIAEQERIPRILMGRLFLENPLLHEIWPMSLTSSARSRWTEITFGDLDGCNNLGFPQLSRERLNPVVFEVSSGPHSVIKGNSVLSYMRQLQIKGQDLSRDEAIEQMEIFPFAWKIQYCDIKTPRDFIPTTETPFWNPGWWDTEQFGRWHDVRLVRCKIPPSYKSAAPSNYHWTMIGFSFESTSRLGVSPPYNRILFWRCFKCPALNGFISMDRHLGALLEGLSFRWYYHSTSRTPNILNTVAVRNRQSIVVLPPVMSSVDIPENVPRRSRNTRLTRSGQVNPLYDTFNPPGDDNQDTDQAVPNQEEGDLQGQGDLGNPEDQSLGGRDDLDVLDVEGGGDSVGVDGGADQFPNSRCSNSSQ